MTKNQRSLDSAVMMSSLMPSEKYSCSASPPLLMKGSTAMAGRSGNGKPARDCPRTSSSGPAALAHDGADQLLVLAAVADRLSCSVDAAGQRRIRNNPAVPD